MFTVLLPVKNGGNYLKKCVESILAQTYQNFDLVVLDNASTDGSIDWLKNLESNNSRVKLYLTETPLSIEESWNRVLSIPKSEYMTIIGHDDLLASNFLEEISGLISENPDANLYTTHFKLIDTDGYLIRYCSPMPETESAAGFLAARLAGIRDSFGTGYVMRSKLYDDVGGIPSYPSLLYSDDALWLKIIGNGVKVTSSKSCFSYRLHTGSTSGKPNKKSLFYALKEYLVFLAKAKKEDSNIELVMSLYGSNYVDERCKEYYFSFLDHKSRKFLIDKTELDQIKNMMLEFSELKLMDDWPKPQILTKSFSYRLKSFLKRILK